ncbi:MAG: glycosyltransferase [Porphyromonas sp.]|nr:glycosyltransferase [Porphyromonas sp.]
MNASPLLSVIVPVYNAAAYLDACISCLAVQGLASYELILVNDGSKDNSLEICQRYAEEDTRILVFDKANGGQSSARNLALQHARGRYIAFLDSDDSLAEGTLSHALGVLEADTQCDFVQFPLLLEAGHPTDERLYTYEPSSWSSPESIALDYARGQQLSWRVCDKVFRRELLEGLRFVEGLVYEDNLYCTEAILRARGAAVINQGCYIYNWNNQSTTHAPKPQSHVDMIDVHGRIHELLRAAGHRKASSYILALVAADVFAAYRGRGPLRLEELKVGARALRRASWGECLLTADIKLQRRLKCLGMKLYSHIANY